MMRLEDILLCISIKIRLYISETGGVIVNNVYWYYGGFYAGNHTFKQLGNIEVIDNIYKHKHLLEENEDENKWVY